MLGSWEASWRRHVCLFVCLFLLALSFMRQNTDPCCSILPYTQYRRHFRGVGSLDEYFNVILQKELSRTRWNRVSC